MKTNRKTRLHTLPAALVLALLFLAGISCRSWKIQNQQPPADPHQPFHFVGKKGMVVAAHPLAAEAGLEMLKRGGNAVDAAIATAFALNVVEPFASGIGGGGFIVIYRAKEKDVRVVNFREKAPASASPSMFKDKEEKEEELRTIHGLAVAVPGALAGWSHALTHFGSKSLAEVTERAVELAEEGFAVSHTFSSINMDEYEKLLQNAGEETYFLNQGFPYEPGEVHRNPDLARTFRLIASRGVEEFYRGEIARKIVRAVQDKGGIMTLEDLASYRPVEQDPLVGTYKDHTLHTIAPPGSGGLHIIQLLNIIEYWPVREWGPQSPLYLHHLSEAFRYVFADRERYLGDPDFAAVPVEALLSKEYAARIARTIKPDRSLGIHPFGLFDEARNKKDNTTHLCVVDREGNIVSLTQSINHFFGSGIVPPGTGILLNNHMDDFSADPDSVNAPGPGRRPVSSMGPLILFRGNEPYLVLGSPGGTRIFPSLTQIIINILEFGMSLDEAIEAPRFFSYSAGGKPRSISLESRFPSETIRALEERGHKVAVREAYDKYFGGAQGILIRRDRKVILGGADSRRDGHGAGY